jgi:hypothetical protein
MTNCEIKYLLFVFSSCFLLFSCATILNRRVEKISVTTDRSARIITIEKAVLIASRITENGTTNKYLVERGRKLLKVNLQINGSEKSIYLKPKNSLAFWLNFGSYGAGMLIDLYSPKRFGYRTSYLLIAGDTANKRYRFIPLKEKNRKKVAPFNQGSVNWTLSLPVLNFFDMTGPKQPYNSTGIFGLATGLEYYYQKNHFLSINLGVATDYLPVEHIGPGYYNSGSILFTSVQENIVLGKFNLGYGLNLSKYFWNETFNDSLKSGQSLNNISLGLSLTAEYRIAKYLNIGILYQPDLWNTSFKPALNYQNYISLKVIWKFPERKGRN